MAFRIFSVWMKEISKTVGFETACFHLAKYYNLFFLFSVGDLKFLPLNLGFISIYTPIMKGGSLSILLIRLLDTFVTLIIIFFHYIS